MSVLKEQARSPQEEPSFLKQLELQKRPTPWDTNSLFRELTSNPPYGEGFLMKEDNEQGTHAQHLGDTIVNAVPEIQKALARCGVTLAMELMDGKRDDGRTPEVSHVLRTTLRALNIKQLTDEELLTIILHDAIEDHSKDFQQKYHAAFAGLPQTDQLDRTLKKTEENVNIMNKKRQKNGKIIDNDEYLKEIENAGLGWIKVLDRIDSERGDFANAVHEDFSPATMQRIFKSHQKTLGVQELVTPAVETEFDRTINLGMQFITTIVDYELNRAMEEQFLSVLVSDKYKQPQHFTVFQKDKAPKNRATRRAQK